MKTITGLLIVCVLMGAGCYAIQGNRLPKSDIEGVVLRARKKYQVEFNKLDLESNNGVAKMAPDVRYYKLAEGVFDYALVWKISRNRIVQVYGRGDLHTLENSKLVVIDSSKDR